MYRFRGTLVNGIISYTAMQHIAHTARVMVWEDIANDSHSTLTVVQRILAGQC